MGTDPNERYEFKITIDDETIKGLESLEIDTVVVDLEVDKLDMATITFKNTPEGSKTGVLAGGRHKIGDAMTIEMGYSSETEVIFTGECVGLEPYWPSGGMCKLTVRGMDHLHRFKRGTAIRFWEKKKDSDIVKAIAGELSLSAKVDATSEKHEYTLQNNVSDAEFLKYLARRNNYELYVKEEKLHFKKPASGGSSEVELKCGTDVLDMRMRLNAIGQVSEVIVRGWDVFQKKEIVGKADKGKLSKGCGKKYGLELAEKAFGKSKAYVTNYPVANQSEANNLAAAMLGGVAGGFLTGSGKCLGDPAIVPGATVKLKEFGDYSGSYYVVAARHIIAQEGYVTEFDIACNTEGKGD